jgi:hypothetical protein
MLYSSCIEVTILVSELLLQVLLLMEKFFSQAYTSANFIMMSEWRMRWVDHVECIEMNIHAKKSLAEKPEGKRPLRRPMCIWEGNVKMGLKEIGWEGSSGSN